MFVYVRKPPFVIESRQPSFNTRSYSVPVLQSCFPYVCRTKNRHVILMIYSRPSCSVNTAKYLLLLQDRTLRISAHHYKRGGANHVCFTGDSQRMLSTGADGVLACWVWNFTSTGNSVKLQSAVSSTIQRKRLGFKSLVAYYCRSLSRFP